MSAYTHPGTKTSHQRAVGLIKAGLATIIVLLTNFTNLLLGPSPISWAHLIIITGRGAPCESRGPVLTSSRPIQELLVWIWLYMFSVWLVHLSLSLYSRNRLCWIILHLPLQDPFCALFFFHWALCTERPTSVDCIISWASCSLDFGWVQPMRSSKRSGCWFHFPFLYSLPAWPGFGSGYTPLPSDML